MASTELVAVNEKLVGGNVTKGRAQKEEEKNRLGNYHFFASSTHL